MLNGFGEDEGEGGGGGNEGRKMCEQRDVGRGIIFSLILEKDVYRMPLYICVM